MVRYLLRSGADPNLMTHQGQTPSDLASLEKIKKILKKAERKSALAAATPTSPEPVPEDEETEYGISEVRRTSKRM